jgi:hypothetical protein
MQVGASQVVAVASASQAVALPEIPNETKTCLSKSVSAERKRAKNVDGAIEIGDKVDKAKAACWSIHMAWYEKLRGDRSGKVSGEAEKVSGEKKQPKATW